MKVLWSLLSSVTSVAGALVILAPVLFLYREIGEARISGEDIYGYHTKRDFNDWERMLFEVLFYCLVLGAAAGTVAISVWLSRRLGGSVRGTLACTLFLIGVAAYPLLLYAAIVNCGFIDGFPLPAACD